MARSKKLAPTKDPRCGTNAGHQAHVRRGERPCAPCRKAHADDVAERKKQTTLLEPTKTRKVTARAAAGPTALAKPPQTRPESPHASTAHIPAVDTSSAPPAAPKGLGKRGRAFWEETMAEYSLTPANRELLTEACRTLDRLDRLDGALRSRRNPFLELEETDPVGDLPTFNVVINSAVASADKLQTTFRATIKQLGISDTGYREAETPPAEGPNIIDMFQAAQTKQREA